MTPLIETVEAKVNIILNNGTVIDISLDTLGELKKITNYVTNINIKESASASNQNPVGVVCSNTMTINLKSNDLSLIPDNELSPYFGYMDNTAIVRITLSDNDSTELGDVSFNDFFVSSWDSNITSQDPYAVIIEATDLLSIINKNDVPSSELIKNASTNQVYLDFITKLNSTLAKKFQVKYKPADIDFSEFPKIEMTNFEADNVGTWQNILSQSTLTNIYYTRENTLKTQYCLDENVKSSVCDLSDTVNILSASIDKGGLVGYSGVKVNYSTNTINNTSELTNLTGQTLTPGDNTFDNIDLGYKIYKINQVIVSCEEPIQLQIKSITYSKSTASIVINNPTQDNITCSILIYGQTIKENKQYIKIYRETNSSGEVLEVTNSILPIDSIKKFANNLLKLISIRSNSLIVEGFFNPRLKLGDIVYVDVEKSINTKGYYRIIELDWKIAMTIKCQAKLSKVAGV